jgi:hypothetical protein
MKTYDVVMLPDSKIDWYKIGKAMIDTYLWSDNYKPEAGAQVVYVNSGDADEGIYAHLWCVEENPRAIYTKHNEPVYLDSCLEFFFTMNSPGKPANGYINIESNSNPTTLIAYGFDRYTRTSIVDMGIEPFQVTSVKTPQRWDLYEFIPLSVLKQVFKIDKVTTDTIFRGNFYKCGGDHKIQPYGSWAPISSPTPDFHRPEYFGELRLVHI